MIISKYLDASKRLFLLTIALFLLLTSCAAKTQQPAFDPKTCFDIIPDRVKGLKIIQGTRTNKSIIRDMVQPMCYGHVLFNRMKTNGETINAGDVVFKVYVEYTGEVYRVTVENTTIQSEEFVRRVSDYIIDTDFVPWVRHDTDTVFLYPAKFGQ
jgi:hypothetical protein